MDPEIDLMVTEAREPGDTDHVALFMTDRGPHHGALFAIPRAVPELVEYIGRNDAFSSPSIQDE